MEGITGSEEEHRGGIDISYGRVVLVYNGVRIDELAFLTFLVDSSGGHDSCMSSPGVHKFGGQPRDHYYTRNLTSRS